MAFPLLREPKVNLLVQRRRCQEERFAHDRSSYNLAQAVLQLRAVSSHIRIELVCVLAGRPLRTCSTKQIGKWQEGGTPGEPTRMHHG
jgi:hypothetical protein